MRPHAFAMNGNPLNRDEIARLIAGDSPLVNGYIDLDSQLQPNGFDLTVRDVARFGTPGRMGTTDSERVLSEVVPLSFDQDDWVELEPGPFLVTYNEVVALAPDLMALGRPRSSLLRSGVSLHTAVWDAGYQGRSQSLLTVHHPHGFRLKRHARVAQLVFFRLSAPPRQVYRGRFQGEGL